MAFPTVVETLSAYTAGDGGDGDFTIPLPATVNAGELLLIAFNYRAGNKALTAGSTAADLGYTEVVNATRGTRGRLYVWYKEAAGTEGGTSLDMDCSANGDAHAQYVIYRIQGWDAVHAADSDGSSNSPNPPSLTVPSGADDHVWLAFCAAADDGASVDTFPTNYTNGGYERRTPPSTNNSATIGWARRELNTATEDPGSFGLSESESWVTGTVAVTPGSKGAASGTNVDVSTESLSLTTNSATIASSVNIQAALETLTLTTNAATVATGGTMVATSDDFDSAMGTSVVTNASTSTPDVTISQDDQADQTGWITVYTRYTGCNGKTPEFTLDFTDFRLTEGPDDPDWEMIWRYVDDTDPGTGRIRPWTKFANGTGANTGPGYEHVFSHDSAFTQDAVEVAIKPRWRYLDTQHAIAYAANSSYGQQLPSCNSSHYHDQITITSGSNSAAGTTLNLYGIRLDNEASQPAGGADKLNIVIFPGQHASEDQGSLHGWEIAKRYIDATGTEADWFRQHCRLFIYDVNPAGKYYGRERWTIEDDGNEDPNRAFDDNGSLQVNAVRTAVTTDLASFGNRMDVMYDCHGSYALNGNPYTVEFGIYADTTNDENYRTREGAAMVADETSDAQGGTFIRDYGSTFNGSASWWGHDEWSAQVSVLPENPAAARGFPDSEAMYYDRRSKWFVTAIKAMVDNDEITLLTDISVSTNTLTLTEYSASISTGSNTDVSVATEALSLTTYPASFVQDIEVAVSTQGLTLSTNSATVLKTNVVNVASNALVLTTNQASVDLTNLTYIEYYDGTEFKTGILKRWNGVTWLDNNTVKRWNGSAYVDV